MNNLYLGLFIIAVGSFCQSSCYVPINKIKKWSWESYWFIQGVFAWLVFPILAMFLTIPEGGSFSDLVNIIISNPKASLMTIFFGVLWGIGGLTFGLSMRYLGVALGQSIALGTCAGLGTVLTPIFMGEPEKLTSAVIIGVIVTLVGIAIIGLAGQMKTATLSEEERRAAVKDFNFPKGIAVALLAGFMSACFAIGLGYGTELHMENFCTDERFVDLPATFLVTLGGFITNAIYCLYQNKKNNTFEDYKQKDIWINNAIFCALAGGLWYCQFFGKSIGGGYIQDADMKNFSWCLLMALNVVFSNVWGIILNEWKGCDKKTIGVLLLGLAVLVVSSFLPTILK